MADQDDQDLGRPPYVSFYASDWKGGTATLPALAEWCYLQLCLDIWDKGEPVKKSRLQMLFVRAGSEWESQVELLIDEGKVRRLRNGNLVVDRALAEYQKASKKRTSRIKAAKIGAEKRWENKENDAGRIENHADGIANQNQNQSQSQRDTIVSPPHSPPSDEDDQHQADFLFSIPDEVWEKFERYRKEIKKPLNGTTRSRSRKTLEKIWNEHGHEPGAVIEQTIDQVWVGLFPLKADRSGPKQSGWRMDDER